MPTLLVAAILVSTALPASAASMRGEVPYRMTLLRAAPGRLLELVAAMKTRPRPKGGLLARHSQGDHWDIVSLMPLGEGAAAPHEALAPPELVAWQEDEIVRGPDLAAIEGFFDARLYHFEMFVAMADKRAELVREREMENAYQHGLGRPETAIFVREFGAAWDAFTIGAFRNWKHYAERDDITPEKAAAAAKAAGFENDDRVGPYLRSLIQTHHDSLVTPIR